MQINNNVSLNYPLQNTAYDSDDSDEPCSIKEFFKNEELKPAHLRQRACCLVCHCKRCNRVVC